MNVLANNVDLISKDFAGLQPESLTAVPPLFRLVLAKSIDFYSVTVHFMVVPLL
jgi:hypothetical protein